MSHQLRIYDNKQGGTCTCGKWKLLGADDSSLEVNHGLHIQNHRPGKRAK